MSIYNYQLVEPLILSNTTISLSAILSVIHYFYQIEPQFFEEKNINFLLFFILLVSTIIYISFYFLPATFIHLILFSKYDKAVVVMIRLLLVSTCLT
jgi:hypothetical protein